MKFQGLVLLAILGVTGSLAAQNDSADFPPPLPGNGEQMPPASVTGAPNLQINVDAELQKFRNELKQFQAMHDEVARDVKSTDVENERISAQQRQELMNLVTKLARDGAARKAAAATRAQQSRQAPPVAAPPADTFLTDQSSSEPNDSVDSSSSQSLAFDSANPLVGSEIADAFALGKVLFNKGEFASAEKAFRKAKVSPENEMTLKYLVATCLRRQSKWRAAIETYKAVAESSQDPVLQKLAKWQLDNIRWHQESESQLDQLKKQREKRLESPKNASVDAMSPTQ